MNQTATRPEYACFNERDLQQMREVKIAQGTTTVGTSLMQFDKVRALLSHRPLRGISARPSNHDDDDEDVKAATKALADEERVPYDDVRRDLGME